MSVKASPFLEQIRGEIRLRGYSIRTEKSYLFWIKQFILFHGKRHPDSMGAEEVKAFLSWLAVKRGVAVNTQKVALNALVFLYHKILKQDLSDMGFTLAAKQRHLPSVLTPAEVALILQHLGPRHRLIVELLYGSGLRITEALRLRVQDIDFSHHAITVRDGKGNSAGGCRSKACLLPYLPAFLCNSSIAIRLRYSQSSRVARPQRHKNNTDLYPCTRTTLY